MRNSASRDNWRHPALMKWNGWVLIIYIRMKTSLNLRNVSGGFYVGTIELQICATSARLSLIYPWTTCLFSSSRRTASLCKADQHYHRTFVSISLNTITTLFRGSDESVSLRTMLRLIPLSCFIIQMLPRPLWTHVLTQTLNSAFPDFWTQCGKCLSLRKWARQMKRRTGWKQRMNFQRESQKLRGEGKGGHEWMHRGWA